ncbi:YfiR family protein [Psychromonas arctica]|uniref:YfiR family protein n=1 Tax=Psychromonas arctica TaxID=168275 RepID=A0ABU9HCK4_9GAMM
MMNIIRPVFSEDNSPSAVKVAYIYNIAKFTRWPESTWKDANAPFVLCSYGEDSVSKALIILENKKIDKHPITVVNVEKDQDFQYCHALYISTDDSRLYRYLLSQVDQQKVLTITDESSFFDSGGFVNLVRENKRLRFQISNQQLSETKLILSSKLLKLSILVD